MRLTMVLCIIGLLLSLATSVKLISDNSALRTENNQWRDALISAHAQLDWIAAGHTGPRPAPVFEPLVYYAEDDLGSPDGR